MVGKNTRHQLLGYLVPPLPRRDALFLAYQRAIRSKRRSVCRAIHRYGGNDPPFRDQSPYFLPIAGWRPPPHLIDSGVGQSAIGLALHPDSRLEPGTSLDPNRSTGRSRTGERVVPCHRPPAGQNVANYGKLADIRANSARPKPRFLRARKPRQTAIFPVFNQLSQQDRRNNPLRFVARAGNANVRRVEAVLYGNTGGDRWI